MELFDVILRRRSIRRFGSASVSDDELSRLLEAARWAPSGGNRQSWCFIAVRDPRMIRAVKMFAEGLYGWPPLIIAVCSKEAGHRARLLLDIGMAVENMLLMATDLGLGGCAIGSFSEEPVKKLLGVPDDVKMVLLISLGRPEGEPSVPPKKDLSEIAYDEKWGCVLNHEKS